MLEKTEAFARFNVMGNDQVQAMALSSGQPLQGYAFEWLKVRSDEEAALVLASQDAQARYARAAKSAAVVAAIAAAIAIPIAIIAIVISYLAWQHPVKPLASGHSARLSRSISEIDLSFTI